MPGQEQIVKVNLLIKGGTLGNTTDFGSVCLCYTHAEADTFSGPYTSLAALLADFDTATYPDLAAAATAVFAQPMSPAKVYVGKLDPLEGTMADQLQAVQDAAIAVGKDFLIFAIDSRDAVDIADAAAWAEASAYTRPKFFCAQSSDADLLTTAAGNIGATLHGLQYYRTQLAYHGNDAEPLDASIAGYLGGVRWDSPNGAGQSAFAACPGITPDVLNDTQYQYARDSYANVYASFGGNIGFYPGVVAKGVSAGAVFSLIWAVVRCRETALYTLFNTKPKIAYDIAGIARVTTPLETQLSRGVTFGHISRDHVYGITAPKLADIPAATRTAGLLELTGGFTVAGGIIAVDLTLEAEL